MLWFPTHGEPSPLAWSEGTNSPFVKRGSGSFRKKDFSKLLITFRSRHFWICKTERKHFCGQYYKRKNGSVIQTEMSLHHLVYQCQSSPCWVLPACLKWLRCSQELCKYLYIQDLFLQLICNICQRSMEYTAKQETSILFNTVQKSENEFLLTISD